MFSVAYKQLNWWSRRLSIKTNAQWAIIFIVIIDWVWAYYMGLTFVGVDRSVTLIMLIASVGFFCDTLADAKRLAHIAYYLALWFSLLAVGSVLTYLAATLQFPLHDSDFSRIDAALGFNWLGWFEFAKINPRIKYLFPIIYSSMFPQIFVSILYFSHSERSHRNEELWWTAMVSLVITAVISGILPAAGTFSHFGVGLDHAVHLPHLFALRDGSMSVISMTKMQGIVTFPSYHTAIAILLIYVYRNNKFFLSFGVINCLMLLSIPSQGGHYLTDMIMGGIVAALSIVIVKSAARIQTQRGAKHLMAPVNLV